MEWRQVKDKIFLNEKVAAVTITDLTGKVMFKKMNCSEIGLEDFPSRVYVVIIRDIDGNIVSREKIVLLK